MAHCHHHGAKGVNACDLKVGGLATRSVCRAKLDQAPGNTKRTVPIVFISFSGVKRTVPIVLWGERVLLREPSPMVLCQTWICAKICFVRCLTIATVKKESNEWVSI